MLRPLTRPGHRLCATILAALALLSPLASQAQSTWTDITAQVAVDEGRGLYDRINRQYIARVTVTNSSGAALAGPVRLVIAATNKAVKSPDGTTTGGEPYFLLVGQDGTLAAGDSIMRGVTFERGRGRLAYATRVEQETAPPPITGTITGTVTDTQTGAPLTGVDIILTGPSSDVTTGAEGTFNIDFTENDVATTPERGDHVTLNAELDGYTAFQTQISVAGDGQVYNLDLSLAPVAASTQNPDPSTTPVDLPASDGTEQTGQLDIPAASVLDAAGNPVTEPVTVEFTPIDPTDPADLAAFPGADFVAAGGDPNDPTTLDSVVLAEITLTGASGTEYSELGLPATIELLLPDDLQGTASGETIPTWYYDEATGLWVEEGAAVIQACSFDAAKQCALFAVNHFTWWNVDRPIAAHACFRGTITQLDGITPVTAPVRAAGVTYNGTSAGNRDYGDPSFYGVSFKRSGQDGPPEPEQVKLFLDKDGQQQYLTNPTPAGANTYQFDLTTDSSAATVLDAPNFSGSTLPSPDSGICQELNILVDFNLSPVVSVSGPGATQTPGGTATLAAVVTDADGNYNPPAEGSAVWSVSGCAATLSNQTPTSTELTGSGGNEDCLVTLTATDDKGAAGSDSVLVRFASGGFVPGDQLTVTVLDERGQPLPASAWAFLSDPSTGAPLSTVSCDPADDGACPADPGTGRIDFGSGFGGGPVDLTVVADLGRTGGEELPVTRMITLRDIPAGALSVVIPGEVFGDPIGDPIGVNAAVATDFQFGVILDYSTPPGTPDFNTVLRAGTRASARSPRFPPNQFDVFLASSELELGGLAAFIGYGVDPTLPGADDWEKVRYGVAVDQDPAAFGSLGSGTELRFDLNETAGLFDEVGPFAGQEGNQVLAWRGGVSYHLGCDAPVVSPPASQVVLCDQFPATHYFQVAKSDPFSAPVGFDSQRFASLPAAPGPLGSDGLTVSVGVSNGEIGPAGSSAEVLLSGPEAAQADMLRVDFRAFGAQFSTIVWSVFQAPPLGTLVATPQLPASLTQFAAAEAYADCDFDGGAPSITAMALAQQSGDTFYTMVQNARLLGDYKPIAPAQSGIFFPEVWPDALWLITADRLQGAGGSQCLSGGAPF